MTYKQLGAAIGVPPPGLGQLLDPIHAYCEAKALPPLTVIVVGKDGMPGVGFPAAQPVEVLRRQREVFSTDWLAHGNPGPSAFAAGPAE
ncbi:hypothetical protein [Thiohalocapsa halophila]|nr:hypothetical protein [Thiohalocapsa halophila]